MATLQNLLDSIRAATAIDASQVVTDTVIKLFINEDYPALFRKVADLSPGCADRVTKVATFDIAAGQSSYTIASPITDFAKARKVGRRASASLPYVPLRLAPFATAEQSCELSWRPRGLVLEVFPATLAPNVAGVDNYQLSYIYKPVLLASSGDVVDLPDGVERILVQLASAKVRIRLKDDPAPHMALARAAWDEEKLSLPEQYPGTPEAFADMTGWYG
jgi:hypothetical protein